MLLILQDVWESHKNQMPQGSPPCMIQCQQISEMMNTRGKQKGGGRTVEVQRPQMDRGPGGWMDDEDANDG